MNSIRYFTDWNLLQEKVMKRCKIRELKVGKRWRDVMKKREEVRDQTGAAGGRRATSECRRPWNVNPLCMSPQQ